jgi:hypothetical protein
MEQTMDNKRSDSSNGPNVLTEVQRAARVHTKMALETLVAVANKETAPASARVAAANAILGRTPWADALRMELAAAGEDGRLLLARIAEMRAKRRARSVRALKP